MTGGLSVKISKILFTVTYKKLSNNVPLVSASLVGKVIKDKQNTKSYGIKKVANSIFLQYLKYLY